MSKRRLSGITLPPPPRSRAKVFDVGVWLIRVLDHRDPAFEMVLQMTSYFSKFGNLSEKQRNALYAVARDAANVMQMQFDDTEQPDEIRRGLRVIK